MTELIEILFGMKTREPRQPCVRGGLGHPGNGNVLEVIQAIGKHCNHELCQNG